MNIHSYSVTAIYALTLAEKKAFVDERKYCKQYLSDTYIVNCIYNFIKIKLSGQKIVIHKVALGP